MAESVFAAFLYLVSTVWLCKFWPMNTSAKAAHKMLVELTSAHLLIHTISPHLQSIAMMHFFHGHNPFLHNRRASRQKIGPSWPKSFYNRDREQFRFFSFSRDANSIEQCKANLSRSTFIFGGRSN